MDKKEILRVLVDVKKGNIGLFEGVKILSLMGEKEIGGSDALPSNGALHIVRECNVSGDSSDKEASVNGSLEKRTSNGNGCEYCLGGKILPVYRNGTLNSMDCFCVKATVEEE